ncbi:MAG: hypothetical protein KC496_08525 [Anaerolineae bacterium]|nr:hypothetical protein [Anaerolineae bacterium]
MDGFLRTWIIGGLVLLLSACSGGAVVFAPTPLPPEAVPVTYEHPSGAFSLLLPRTWALHEQATSAIASASFTAPNSEVPIVHVQVLNLGQEIPANDLGALMDQYQTQFRRDANRYTEQSRTAMGDGSWRITGLRTTASGEPQQINTFIQAQGTLLSVIEVTLPADARLRTQTETIINTFTLGTQSDIPAGTLAAFSSTSPIPVEITNVSTWTTPEGVFFVTGEVTNFGAENAGRIPVRAQLLTAEGSVVADASDAVMGYGIEPGGFAPFSIRFGQGQPVNAVQYTVILGNENGAMLEAPVLITAPTLEWTEETQVTQDGDLFILGEITNTGAESILRPRALATIFDDRGRVIGAGFADADMEILAAGDATSFTILLSDLGGSAANYVVAVQALPCDASCE